MNWFLIQQTQPIQAWQYVMLVPLISCLFLLMAGWVSSMTYGAAHRSEIYDLPKWLIIPAGFGVLMFIGMPATLVFQYLFITLMHAFGAPTSSVVVMSIMVIGSWILFVWATFGWIRAQKL